MNITFVEFETGMGRERRECITDAQKEEYHRSEREEKDSKILVMVMEDVENPWTAY